MIRRNLTKAGMLMIACAALLSTTQASWAQLIPGLAPPYNPLLANPRLLANPYNPYGYNPYGYNPYGTRNPTNLAPRGVQPSGNYGPAQRQPCRAYPPAQPMAYAAYAPAPGRVAASQTNTVLLDVRVPTPDAEVWVSGAKTAKKGTSRTYISPPLVPGDRYVYEVRAQWYAQGQTTTQTRLVPVRAGDRLSIDFTLPAVKPQS